MRKQILKDSDKPNLGEIVDLFNRAYNGASDLRSYIGHFKDVRYCRWEGQRPDNRKHGTEENPAFPWDGASDMRVFVMDDIINKNVALAMRALWKSKVVGSAKRIEESERANAVASFLSESFKGIKNIRREMKLALNWALGFGVSAVSVQWRELIARKPIEVRAEDIAGISESVRDYLAPESDVLLEDGKSNPFFKAACEDIKRMYDCDESSAGKLLRDVKRFGVGEILADEIYERSPRIKALKVGYDLILPSDIDDIDDAPYVFLQEYLTACELLQRAQARRWNKEFVSRLFENEQEGEEKSDTSARINTNKSDYSSSKLYRVITAYYSTYTKKGSLVRRICVFNPDIELVGECGILDLEPMRYPFVVLTSEDVEREILDSRAQTEIGECWQSEIKTQKDLRVDASSMSINPPKFYKIGTSITQFKPGGWYPMRSSDMKILEEFKSAADTRQSIEIENNLRTEAMNYFGAQSDAEGAEIGAQKYCFISDVFEFGKKILKQLQWLYAQYSIEALEFLPSEGNFDGNISLSRRDFEGEIDYEFSYDFNDENAERFVRKFDTLAKFVNVFDRNGDTNGINVLRHLISGLFPRETRSFISTPSESSSREILETQQDLAAIYSLQSVNAPEKCNVSLRMKIIENYMQNPSIQARLSSDEDFANALSTYVKQLQFKATQDKNAIIGRLGTAPASGIASNMEM